jgi:hypothetical protein
MRGVIYLMVLFLFSNCSNVNEGNSSEIKSEKKEIESFSIESLLTIKSFDDLSNRFGKENIQVEFVDICDDCGVEGSSIDEPYYITTIYPDSIIEIVLEWNVHKNHVDMISVYRPNSPWQTKHNLKIGDNISKLYNLNIQDSLFYFHVFQLNLEQNYRIELDGNISFSPNDFEKFHVNDQRLKNIEIYSITLHNRVNTSENNDVVIDEDNFESSQSNSQKTYQDNEVTNESDENLEVQKTNNGIRIGNLEIRNSDLGRSSNWYEARAKIDELGGGWRLPTKKEVKEIILPNKSKIPKWSWEYDYWSTEVAYSSGTAFSFNFYNEVVMIEDKYSNLLTRAVRNIK